MVKSAVRKKPLALLLPRSQFAAVIQVDLAVEPPADLAVETLVDLVVETLVDLVVETPAADLANQDRVNTLQRTVNLRLCRDDKTQKQLLNRLV
jgi:hypothetical protein